MFNSAFHLPGGKARQGEKGIKGERVSGTCEEIEFGPVINSVNY
jgi:hypothetical protein